MSKNKGLLKHNVLRNLEFEPKLANLNLRSGKVEKQKDAIEKMKVLGKLEE